MKARASRMALKVASEPELTNRTRSAHGTSEEMRRASPIACRFSMEKKWVPRAACSVTAATTASWACPRISGPEPRQ